MVHVILGDCAYICAMRTRFAIDLTLVTWTATLSAMSSGWTHEQTRALVSVWSQANVQSELDGVTRNRVVFERIAKEMEELGYEYTWQQCRTKIKNLTQKYRKVRFIV